MQKEEMTTAASGSLEHYSMTLLHTLLLTLIWMITSVVTAFTNIFTQPIDMHNLIKTQLQHKTPRPKVVRSRQEQCILVTGCDRGFGRAIAKRLDDEGFCVVAGCLYEENISKLQSEGSARLHTVKLDVTSRQDLDETYNWIKSNMQDKEMLGVVNNAGVCFVGTPEIMSANDLDKIIDVNFRGTVNVTRKFLPLIRQSQGRVVNIGSLNGEVPMPFFSMYNATKAAIKMFTESLAYEVKDWGVKVSLVAPSAFKTGIITYDRTSQANKWWAEAASDVREDYGKDYFMMPMRVSARMKVGEDYTPVVDSVMDALTGSNPKHIYRIGTGSVLLPTICKFVPRFIRTYVCGCVLNFVTAQPRQLRDN